MSCALRACWQAGKFPINRTKPERTPVFVDEDNTACAVAALLLATDANPLTQQIQQEKNYADLSSLLAYEELPRWADEHGFAAEELAWIQPTYGNFGSFVVTPFRNNLGVTGKGVYDLEVFNDELYLAGDFSAIDGFPANAIAVWNLLMLSGYFLLPTVP